MDNNSIWAVLITAITVLGSTSAWRYYEKRADRKEQEEDAGDFDYDFEEEDEKANESVEEDAGFIGKAKRKVDEYATDIHFLIFLINYIARCPSITANKMAKAERMGTGSLSSAEDQEKNRSMNAGVKDDPFSKEKDEMRETILSLTEKVAQLTVKVEFLQKENTELMRKILSQH